MKDKIRSMIDEHLAKPKGLEVRIMPKKIFYTGSDLTEGDLKRISDNWGVKIITQAQLEKEMYTENDAS